MARMAVSPGQVSHWPHNREDFLLDSRAIPAWAPLGAQAHQRNSKACLAVAFTLRGGEARREWPAKTYLQGVPGCGSSESTACWPFGPQAEAADLLPGLNGIRSGHVSMLVMIIVGSYPERFRVSPGNGSLVPRVVFRV